MQTHISTDPGEHLAMSHLGNWNSLKTLGEALSRRPLDCFWQLGFASIYRWATGQGNIILHLLFCRCLGMYHGINLRLFICCILALAVFPDLAFGISKWRLLALKIGCCFLYNTDGPLYLTFIVLQSSHFVSISHKFSDFISSNSAIHSSSLATYFQAMANTNQVSTPLATQTDFPYDQLSFLILEIGVWADHIVHSPEDSSDTFDILSTTHHDASALPTSTTSPHLESILSDHAYAPSTFDDLPSYSMTSHETVSEQYTQAQPTQLEPHLLGSDFGDITMLEIWLEESATEAPPYVPPYSATTQALASPEVVPCLDINNSEGPRSEINQVPHLR